MESAVTRTLRSPRHRAFGPGLRRRYCRLHDGSGPRAAPGCTAAALAASGRRRPELENCSPTSRTPEALARRRGLNWAFCGTTLRGTYDRVFFADVDQFYNIDIRDVLERDLPPRVAIAMCNDGCSRDDHAGTASRRSDSSTEHKSPAAGHAHAQDAASDGKTFQQCDNLGRGDNRNVATRSFWTRFPRKIWLTSPACSSWTTPAAPPGRRDRLPSCSSSVFRVYGGLW